MFERRLKVFLLFLVVVTLVLVARAMELQVIQRAKWADDAAHSLQHESLIPTTRGRLLDVRGRQLALDIDCIDACVDYRAIPKEPEALWVHKLAVARIKARDNGHHDPSISAKQLLADEVAAVKADIDSMWTRLAHDGRMTAEQMDEIRQAIVHDVEMRRRSTWYRRYLLAQKAQNVSASTQPLSADSVEPWYRKWLLGETDVAPVDTFDIKIDEQTEPHVILRSISPEMYNELGKAQERYPGLVLQPGMKRSYPFAEAASHVLGRLTRVDQSDLKIDPWLGDDLRRYERSDLIGSGGLEGLCEPLLRGTRGRIKKVIADDGSESKTAEEREPFIPGQDVRTTIDIELEEDIRAAFKHVTVTLSTADPTQPTKDEVIDLHGAAVVIDVPTGQVRAMVSVPDFDPNTLDETYAQLVQDDLNHPLLNRATQAMLETGSTIKPVVGIGAITQGVMGINDTIECTGFLSIAGHEIAGGARCWTLSKFGWDRNDPRASHHRIPFNDAHPTGFLTFPDALQRSCNVFFENMGSRLGVDGLSYWMRTFGLGRITGVGVSEARGRLPDVIPIDHVVDRKSNALLGGIGQGYVAATPIQMANVAATVARNGIWMRPRLLSDDVSQQLRSFAANRPTTEPSWMDVPDRADLNLSPAAVAAAQEGMFRVVNTLAGTGNEMFQANLQISGKTGTAQAAPFSIPVRDQYGQIIFDNGKMRKFSPDPSTPEHPNPQAPWYLGFDEKTGVELKHSWYIGFAPSHNPKIAFAVLVEYGGSGGKSAGTIASHIIERCVEHGYVPLDTQTRALVP